MSCVLSIIHHRMAPVSMALPLPVRMENNMTVLWGDAMLLRIDLPMIYV